MTDRKTFATGQSWAGVYPENSDAYALFERLDAGETVELTVRENRFELRFEGDPVGYDCWLVVKTAGNRSRRYGWGQRVEHVYQALEEANAGWNRPRLYPFKTYSKHNTREAQLV